MAPGSRLHEERQPRRDAEPSGAAGRDQRGLSQPDQAGVGRLHRGLLLQAADRQGAAGAAREGADRAEQLPQGRGGRRAVASAGAEGDRGGRRPIATSSARTTSSSRCSGTASRSSASVNSGLPAIARDLELPLVCTNDVHYLRETDAHPHDILLCIGTGKAFSDPKRLRYDAKQFFLKTPRRWRRSFKDFPDALANTVRIAERCNVTLAEGENYLPNFDVPRRLHARRLLRARRARRVRGAAAAAAAAGRVRRAAPHDRRVRAAAVVRDRHDQADEVPGVLPDRLGLHPLRARAGHSGRARAAARRPAAWSPTACGSPTSIRSTST